MDQRFFHYGIKLPNGWRAEEYRVFPRTESEANITRDWRDAVSDYAADCYDEFYMDEENETIIPDLGDFIADALKLSFVEEISENDYFSGIDDILSQD